MKREVYSYTLFRSEPTGEEDATHGDLAYYGTSSNHHFRVYTAEGWIKPRPKNKRVRHPVDAFNQIFLVAGEKTDFPVWGSSTQARKYENELSKSIVFLLSHSSFPAEFLSVESESESDDEAPVRKRARSEAINMGEVITVSESAALLIRHELPTKPMLIPPEFFQSNENLFKMIVSHSVKPIAANQSNAMLNRLVNIWVTDLRNIAPNYSVGLEILRCLCAKREPIGILESHGPIIADVQPTLERVCEDYLAMAPETEANITDSTTPLYSTISKAKFLANFLRSHGIERWDERAHTVNALSIPASKEGIGACRIDTQAHIPDALLWKVRNTHKRIKNLPIALSSTLSPPGAVTALHVDTTIASQYIVHIEGLKLWIFAPWTPNNIEQMLPHRVALYGDPLEVVRRLENMENLQILIAEEPIAFTLPPRTIHCVMTFKPSTHTGVSYFDPQLTTKMQGFLTEELEAMQQSHPDNHIYFGTMEEVVELEMAGDSRFDSFKDLRAEFAEEYGNYFPTQQ
jgi:hypothetical protein